MSGLKAARISPQPNSPVATASASRLPEPSQLLCDEPTGNLDSATTKTLLDLFDELRSDGRLTLIIITHDEAVSRRADRRIEIVDGVLSEISI